MESGLWSGLPLSIKLLTSQPWKKKVNTSCQSISYTRSSGHFECFYWDGFIDICPWSQEVQYPASKGLLFKVLLILANTLGHPETHVKPMAWKLYIHTPNFSDSRSGVIRIFEAHCTCCLMKSIANTMEEKPDKEHQKQTGTIISFEDATVVTEKDVKTIKPETIYSCWRKLCPDVVHDFIQFVTEPIKETVKELFGKWIWQKWDAERWVAEGFQDRHLRNSRTNVHYTRGIKRRQIDGNGCF